MAGTVNDEIMRATAGPTLNDGLMSYYLANGGAGATLQDRETTYLTAKGFPVAGGTVQDRWMAYLASLGYTGALTDRWFQFWLARPTGGVPVKTQRFFDDFQRAPGGLGANYEQVYNPNTLQVVNPGECWCVMSQAGIVRLIYALSANQYAQVRCVTVTATVNEMSALFVRCVNPVASIQGYMLRWAATFIQIHRLDPAEVLLASVATGPVIGDTMLLGVIGTRVFAQKNGVEILFANDATYAAANRAGLAIYGGAGPTGKLDDFAAGDWV